jgi:hypothetical protein
LELKRPILRLSRSLLIAAVVLFAACGDVGNGSSKDASLPAMDSGAPLPDASVLTPDAGSSDAGLFDAGLSCTSPIASPPNCSATTLEGKLGCIPGMTVTSTVTDAGIPGYTRYELTYLQPVDHAQPDAGGFGQRISLLYRSDLAPTVLSSTGYGLSRTRTELSYLFSANQVSIEHRYFAASIPAAPVDWTKLNIEQSAKDFHRIRVALAHLFPARWVSTGGSKGGMSAVFYRRFFPCDVDGTVAYVAPHTEVQSDPRDIPFLQAVGGAARQRCRDKLTAFQRGMLTRRAELSPFAVGPFTRAGSADIAFEHMALEMNFSFWQYQNPDDPDVGCSAIPPPDAPATQMTDYIDAIVGLDEYSDDTVAYFAPYYYQVATQLGDSAVDEAPFADLVLYPGTDNGGHYSPPDVPHPYSSSAMVDVGRWLATSGHGVLLVYGELDPWTATPFELGQARDSARLTAPGKGHITWLQDLAPVDFALAKEKLERWLATPLSSNLRPVPVQDDPIDPADLLHRRGRR